jgi:DNA-binding beta-propeller fold protein YncE
MRLPSLLFVLLFASIQSVPAATVDISDPLRLMFVSDAESPVIDVIDLEEEKVVYRIETDDPVDGMVVTPYAPVLVFTNVEKRLVSLYDLRSKKVAKKVVLPIVPRHMVLDTTGSKIGFTDSKDGGFVLFSAYGGSVILQLDDFPPTTDVLFDPNDVDIYYSDSRTGSIGLIDTNLKETVEINLIDAHDQQLSSPSRSLDARYVYVANRNTGEVYSLNAFSKVIYKTFRVGDEPARPYTTPEGAFLYMMDKKSGRFMSIEQYQFSQYEDTVIGEGIDLVTVGRFDRMNLLASTRNKSFYLYDNVRKAVVKSGTFHYMPLDAKGSPDGTTAYVAFRDGPEVAIVDLEGQEVRYVPATDNGVGALAVGLTNNVCH